MALRIEWVEALHGRLIALYGARFMAGYAEMPPELVRASWADVLDGLTSGDIAHALKHLDPDWPPNALQFRRLAQGRPRYAQRLLEPPRADPAHVQAMLERMQRVTTRPAGRAWAYELKRREESGERLTRAQAAMWRAALPYGTPHASTLRTSEASIGAAYSSVDDDTLHQTLDQPLDQAHHVNAHSLAPGGSESAGRPREKNVGAPSSETRSISP